MTELQQTSDGLAVPPWTTGWRLQRALAWADMTTEQMAQELGVSRSTISRWVNDRGTPSRGYLKLWAMRCRVPLDWLTRGELPHLDSNQEPFDLDTEAPPVTTDELRAAFLKHLGNTGVIRSSVRSGRKVRS